MSGVYIPPHLRSKPNNSSFNQKHGRNVNRRNTFGDDLKTSKKVPLPFNRRFDRMFSSQENYTPTSQGVKKKKKYRDHPRSGCIALYSKRHDSIYLMGSEEDTICIKIHPVTAEVTKLIDLPYFRSQTQGKEILTPLQAWFDANEDFIFILSMVNSDTYKIIKYDMIKNRFLTRYDTYTFNVGKNCLHEQVTICTYKSNNKYHTHLLTTVDERTYTDIEHYTPPNRLLKHFHTTDSKKKFSHVTPDQLPIKSTRYGIASTYSKRTKKVYFFGWQICEESEFGIMTLDVTTEKSPSSESLRWCQKTAPKLDYFINLRYFNICMIDDRYCIFVGGKKQSWASISTSILHKDIYIYDVVLDSWEKSPSTLYKPLCKVSCTYDEKRRNLHLIGGLEQFQRMSWNEYENVKFYRKLNIADVIPGFRDLKLVKSVLKTWFEKSKEKIFGRWNSDISKLIHSYC